MYRTFLAIFGVLALTLFTGCQMSASAGQPAASATPQKAILVTGNGGTEIFLPSTGPEKVVMLSTSGNAKVCPQCEADAIKYFETGELVEKCSMCGATRTAYTYTLPPTNVGHN
jgi:ABC-type Fe3+-hydroxamate transport system substrate-binding protein